MIMLKKEQGDTHKLGFFRVRTTTNQYFWTTSHTIKKTCQLGKAHFFMVCDRWGEVVENNPHLLVLSPADITWVRPAGLSKVRGVLESLSKKEGK